MNNKLKGVICDMDGTLIHFQIDYQRCREITIQLLEEYGYPTGVLTTEHFVLEMVKQGKHYFSEQLALPQTEIQRIMTKIDIEIAKVEKEASFQATQIPGITKFLQHIQDQSLKLGILTLNTTANAVLSLKSADLDRFFTQPAWIVGRDQVVHHKPHKDHADTLLKRMGLAGHEVVVIGDHPSDIDVANTIGAVSIAVCSPKHPKSEFATPYAVDRAAIYPAIWDLLQDLYK
ncbi:MAG: HAD family hydrolase [Promethearchaeota archaeon]